MNGLCITDAVKQFGVTSKTLRYYERIGLLEAKRADNNNYRYYDESEVERIKQIIVLRKMQISIKDIIRIYDNEDMSTVVEVFVNRINDINDEIGALSELKRITNEFLQVMLQNGVTKISTLPILYEQMEKQLDALDGCNAVNYAELSSLSDKLARPVESSILPLPSMRVLSSVRKDGRSDPDGFWRWVQARSIPQGEPGRHERFEFQTDDEDVFMIQISSDFINDSEYTDSVFNGGLFAAANIYLDEDIAGRFRALIQSFDDNKYYQIDYRSDGSLRHAAMLENLISPDDQRELVSLLLPVKKRLADPALFDQPIEVTDISIGEIESANPVLWTVDVPFDTLKPINNPHYRILDNGELEYTGWILTRVLSTEVKVKLPFRVDIEFRIGDEKLYGYGATEESICLYHGDHGLNHNYVFGINMDNSPDVNLSAEAIRFHQPIFRDIFHFPKRGRINNGVYNNLTWIFGKEHLAVIINDEIRYCGVDFPYMAVDLSREPDNPIVIGSNGQGMKYFKSIRVSQLAEIPKNKLREGELTMITRQSNNIIPNIHRLITDEYGENYWFNGCARYVMECLGEYKNEPDYGFWMFAGLTGDILTQVYSYNDYLGECVSACMFNREGGEYFEKIFEKCGYASTFVSAKQLSANKEMYMQTLMAYIDKGVPVIAVTHGGPPWGIYVGYEEYGKTLLFLTGNNPEPERVPIEQIIVDGVDLPHHVKVSPKEMHIARGWLFVGEKTREVNPAQIYRDIILSVPELFAVKNEQYCFGAEAFRTWADAIDSGRFDGVNPENFDDWGSHTSNICNMATNGSCVHSLLERAQKMNPDFTFMEEIHKLYKRTADLWNNDNGEDLEALGGGFNVTLEALLDKDRRGKIAAKIREAAVCMDKVLQIIENKAKENTP